MILKLKPIPSSEITPRGVYMRRCEFLGGALATAVAGVLPAGAAAMPLAFSKSAFSTGEAPTPLADVTGYNNFYEFGTRKTDASNYAGAMKTSPWSVMIDGLVSKPATYTLEDILKPISLEERIYRLRCVEGWSMVMPWTGFPAKRAAVPRAAARPREIRGLRDAGAALGDARPAGLVPNARLALSGRLAARRGHAPAHHSGRRALRRDAAEPERRAHQARGAVEVRLQEHQVHRAHQSGGEAAGDLLEHAERRRNTASIPT